MHARKDGPAAAAAFAEAVREGRALLPASRGALLRRRAEALALAGDAVGAAEELKRCGTMLAEADNAAGARRAGVEQAAAWHAAGQVEQAQRVCDHSGRSPRPPTTRMSWPISSCSRRPGRWSRAIHRQRISRRGRRATMRCARPRRCRMSRPRWRSLSSAGIRFETGVCPFDERDRVEVA
jgi:hypothetical protein